jgi:hypothetical protein
VSNTLRTFALLLLALLVVKARAQDNGPSPQQAIALFPTGCWTINANGHRGSFCVPSHNADGTFTGSMTLEGEATDTVTGYWAGGPAQISFIRYSSLSNPFAFQSYTGFLYPQDFLYPSGPQNLAGSFTVFGPAGGGVQTRALWGWTASQ